MRSEDFFDLTEEEIIEMLMRRWETSQQGTKNTLGNKIPWWSDLRNDRWLDYSLETSCYEYVFKRFLTGGNL